MTFSISSANLASAPSYHTRVIEQLRIRNLACITRSVHRRPVFASAKAAATRAASHAEQPVDAKSAIVRHRSQARKRLPQQLGEFEKESLQLLGWPELCYQIACFCRTPMGAQAAVRARLSVGYTLEESELLYRQSREAAAAQHLLSFQGLYDLRRVLDTASSGIALHPLVLGAVATTLAAARRLRDSLNAGGESTAALQYLARGIEDGLPALRSAIEACINPSEGRVMDTASSALQQARTQRRANLEELRRTADDWSKTLHAIGAAERAQVVIRRDRLCVPVKAGRQGELPRGSVVLATSASKNTVYVEPAPLVDLNNAEMALAVAEHEEEERILKELSAAIAAQVRPLRRLLRAVQALDIASARARHADWLGGAEPHLVHAATPQAHEAVNTIHATRVMHPLLLADALPSLPPPPLPEAASPIGATDGPMAAASLVPELWREMAPRQAKPPEVASRGDSDKKKRSPPVPIDLMVPPQINVVAVTGPNTGGKTASLKTLGLLSLMAKAGISIPVARGMPAELSSERITMMWFDRILADIGDGQSLQQNLSTFSGHVRRLRGVLEETTPASLVLLDELGSGTDPGEGAALAAAMLLHLAKGRAALTFATSHHAEIKELAASQPGFVNASVEFDVATLRPTYRLVWGRTGESNALSVAQGLGFDSSVLTEARNVVEEWKGRDGANDADESFEHGGRVPACFANAVIGLQQSLEQQLIEASASAEKMSQRRAAAEADLADVEIQLTTAQHEVESAQQDVATAADALATLQEQTAAVLENVRHGRMTPHAAEAVFREILRVDSGGQSAESGVTDGAARDSTWLPELGDAVIVSKMAGVVGEVVDISEDAKRIAVRIGTLTVDLRPAEVVPADALSSSESLAKMNASRTAGRIGMVGDPRAAKLRLRARGTTGSLSNKGKGVGATLVAAAVTGVAIQTPSNTVALRGLSGDEAVVELEAAVHRARAGSALFAVHGIGTGRVRAAVIEWLRRRRGVDVDRWEEAPGSNGGCTVVWVK